MVDAGAALLARRGYGITMLEVIKEAEAPRGSIYYHFPGGKDELVVDVAARIGSELRHLVEVMARRNPGIADFLGALVQHHAKRLAQSGFVEGCPLLGVTVSVDIESSEIREAVAAAFEIWVDAISSALREKGLDAPVAARLASTTVAAVEGAIVLGRATRSRRPLDDFGALIPALVAGLDGSAAA
jgi:TetR/AcrR family transcriptional repressor of lmrAB and yxaGH operons